VTWHQVLAAFLALLAYAVLVANVALLFSVICPTSGEASLVTGICVFNYHLLWGFQGPGTPPWAANSSILDRLDHIMTTGFAEPAVSFQVISHAVAGAVFFLLACGLFERFNRDSAPCSAGQGLLHRARVRIPGFGAGRPWPDAFAWKDFHFLTGGVPMLVAKLLIYPILIAAYCLMFRDAMFLQDSSSESGLFNILALGEAAVIVTTISGFFESTWLAASIFRVEVESRTLSALMLLPYKNTMGRIAWAKATGGFYALVPCAT